tara:strand:- start:581 stop:1039 length:459 start_codon:yes stop_codon:yes gene_type:complete
MGAFRDAGIRVGGGSGGSGSGNGFDIGGWMASGGSPMDFKGMMAYGKQQQQQQQQQNTSTGSALGSDNVMQDITNRVTALESASSNSASSGVDPGAVNPNVTTSNTVDPVQPRPEATDPRLLSQSPETIKGLFGGPPQPNLGDTVAKPIINN